LVREKGVVKTDKSRYRGLGGLPLRLLLDEQGLKEGFPILETVLAHSCMLTCMLVKRACAEHFWVGPPLSRPGPGVIKQWDSTGTSLIELTSPRFTCLIVEFQGYIGCRKVVLSILRPLLSQLLHCLHAVPVHRRRRVDPRSFHLPRLCFTLTWTMSSLHRPRG
jgi:hypothetical protein